MTDIAACFCICFFVCLAISTFTEKSSKPPMNPFKVIGPDSPSKAFRWTWQSPDTSNRWGCSSMGGVFGGVVAKGCEQNPESFKDAPESQKNSGNK